MYVTTHKGDGAFINDEFLREINKELYKDQFINLQQPLSTKIENTSFVVEGSRNVPITNISLGEEYDIPIRNPPSLKQVFVPKGQYQGII